MADLFENMGFNANPFSRFSAEEEKEYLQKIFVQPKYYATIHSDIKSGTSRFIFGERGVGKSALVLNLMNDFSEERVLSVYPFLRWRLLLIALYNIHYLCIKMRVTYYKWVTLIFCEFLQKFSSIICA
jgi:DNA replication protein DnaC